MHNYNERGCVEPEWCYVPKAIIIAHDNLDNWQLQPSRKEV